MTHFRRIAAVFAASALTLGGTLALTASPAAAAPSSCPNVQMCGFNNSTYRTNQGAEFNPPLSNGTCENVAFNDQWSSIHNGSGKVVRFFAQANCAGGSGTSFTIANGSGKSDLGISNPTFQDEISSFRWGG